MTQEIVEKIINWLRIELNIPENVIINFELVSDWKFKYGGGCLEVVDKNNYIITINLKYPPKEIVDTCSHEMWHLKEYYFGELIRRGNNYSWQGNQYHFWDWPIGMHPHEFTANRFMRRIRNSLCENCLKSSLTS